MKPALLALAILLSLGTVGQQVDLISTCSTVELKSDARFDGIVSSLVFTVSWPERESLAWESSNPAVRVSPSGKELTLRGRKYLTFSAVGMFHLKDANSELSPTTGLVVLKYSGTKLRLEGVGKAINTSYYVALNGQNSTGWVETLECKERVEVLVFPNPAQTEINVSIIKGNFSEISLVSSDGKTVYRSSITQDRFVISANSFSTGQYFVRLIGDDQFSTKIIIKK